MLGNRFKKIKKAVCSNRFYIILFFAVTALAAVFPPSADDIGWATSAGWDLLQEGFRGYNGRYLGNLSALFLTRVPYILPAIKSATLVLTICLMQKFVPQKSHNFFYICALLLLLPSPLFRQAFVWTAGFSNYFLPLPVIMACMYLLFIKRDLCGAKKLSALAVLLCLGIAGQLFMEPFTIMNLLTAVVAIFYFVVKERKADLRALVYFIGCAIGAYIMFSNSAYMNILQKKDMYQSLNAQTSSIWKTIADGMYNLCHNVSLRAIISCFPALIVIVVFSCILLKKNRGVAKKIKVITIILTGMSALAAVAFPVLYFYYRNAGEAQTGAVADDAEQLNAFAEQAGIAVFVFLIVTSIFCGLVIYYCTDALRKKRIGIYALLIAVQVAPLCFVFPIGPRCYNGVYVLLIMLAGELLGELEEKAAFAKSTKPSAQRILRTLLTVVLIIDIIGYSIVFFANNNKIRTIRQEVDNGATQVTLEHTPFRFLVYALDTEDRNDSFNKRFCEYYGFPKGTEISYR